MGSWFSSSSSSKHQQFTLLPFEIISIIVEFVHVDVFVSKIPLVCKQWRSQFCESNAVLYLSNVYRCTHSLNAPFSKSLETFFLNLPLHKTKQLDNDKTLNCLLFPGGILHAYRSAHFYMCLPVLGEPFFEGVALEDEFSRQFFNEQNSFCSQKIYISHETPRQTVSIDLNTKHYISLMSYNEKTYANCSAVILAFEGMKFDSEIPKLQTAIETTLLNNWKMKPPAPHLRKIPVLILVALYNNGQGTNCDNKFSRKEIDTNFEVVKKSKKMQEMCEKYQMNIVKVDFCDSNSIALPYFYVILQAAILNEIQRRK